MNGPADLPTTGGDGQRGAALLLVLFAFAMLGLILNTAFVAATSERRAARAFRASIEAREAAEAGLAALLSNWAPSLGLLSPGGVQTLPSGSTSTGASYVVSVVRLTGSLYWIRSDGLMEDAGGNLEARSLVGAWVRVDPLTPGGAHPLAERAWAPLPD